MAYFAPVLALAAFVTIIAIEVLRRRAPGWGLVDHPGGRKAHESATPVVGGLAVAASLLLTWAVVPAYSPPAAIQIGFMLLVALGAIDDLLNLGARSKFLLQAFIAGAVLVATSTSLQTLGEVAPGWVLVLGWLSLPFSVFAVASVLNAVNMSDGVDGLAGSLCLVALLALSLIAMLSGNTVQAVMVAVVATACIGFLMFNVRLPGGRPARVFMGDAGSLGLGFLIALFALELAAAQSSVPPAVLIWVCVVPLFDGLSVILSRLVRRAGASQPGRDHLHHLLLQLGASPARVVACEAGAGLAVALLAIIAWRSGVPDWVLVAAFGAGFVAFHAAVSAKWAGLRRVDESSAGDADLDITQVADPLHR